MSKEHIKPIQIWVFLVCYGLAFILGGWLMTRDMEYRRGVIDGNRATMISDYTVEPCEITYEIRRFDEQPKGSSWGASGSSGVSHTPGGNQ